MSDDVKQDDTSGEANDRQTGVPSGPPSATARWRERGAMAAATIMYLLLADVAIETYLAGSPVRWWVVGIAGGYILVTIAVAIAVSRLWVRMSWSTKAMVSLLVLLALLAITAWQRNGLPNGVRLAGQPTDIVFSAVTALSIVAAAVVCMGIRIIPIPARIGLTVIAAYGAAAFLWGIYLSTPFVTLFEGESLWGRLPRWMQGAFLGGIVILPVAALLQATLPAPTGFRHNLPQRLLRALSLLIVAQISTAVFVSVDSEQLPASAAAHRPPVGESSNANTAKMTNGSEQGTVVNAAPGATVVELEHLFDALETSAQRIPRDTFDSDAVLSSVGRNPSGLFAWVRDKTLLVPYQGSLRGPIGVLMDRTGNSLDRALLLQHLLAAAGFEARLARATLDDNEIDQLLKQTERYLPRKVEQADSTTGGEIDLDHFSRQFGLDVSAVRTTASQISQQQTRIQEELSRRVVDQTGAIISALGEQGASNASEDHEQRRSGVRDHWWVQWFDGAAWQDLDTSLPTLQMGQVLSRAQVTMRVDDLPRELLHTVELRVVVERLDSGRLHQDVALQQLLVASRLMGERIVLRHLPMQWPEEARAETGLARLTELATQQTQWLPVLTVGARPGYDKVFDVNGDVMSPLATQGAGALGRGQNRRLEKAGGLFDGLPSGTDEPKRSVVDDTGLTAEWIEYTITRPGKSTQVIRRPIFDLIGEGKRRDGHPIELKIDAKMTMRRGIALLGEVEILLTNCALSGEFLADLMSRALLANRSTLVSFAKYRSNPEQFALPSPSSKTESVPGVLHALAGSRLRWNPSASSVFLDQVNIFGFLREFELGANDGVILREGFDIVANEVGATGASSGERFRARLIQGIVDTNAEGVLTGECADTERELVCPGVKNTAQLFAESRRKGTQWLKIGQQEVDQLSSVGLSHDVLAQIAKQIEAGYVVMVPENNRSESRSAIGWWRIEPTSGDILGFGPMERGLAMVEYINLGIRSGFAAFCLYQTGYRIGAARTEPEMTHAILAASFCAAGLGTGALGRTAVGAMFGLAAEDIAILATISMIFNGLAGADVLTH